MAVWSSAPALAISCKPPAGYGNSDPPTPDLDADSCHNDLSLPTEVVSSSPDQPESRRPTGLRFRSEKDTLSGVQAPVAPTSATPERDDIPLTTTAAGLLPTVPDASSSVVADTLHPWLPLLNQSVADTITLDFPPATASLTPIVSTSGWDPTVTSVGPVRLAQTDDANPVDLLPGDPELGIIRVRNPLEDPELGILRIRQQPLLPVQAPSPPAPVGFLTARLSAVNSDNIFLVLDQQNSTLTGDQFLRPGLSLAFYPALGPQTYLLSSVDMNFQRYIHESEANYDELRFRLGIRQGLSARSYGQFLMSYQQLFYPSIPKERFYENTAFGLTLGRHDPLTSRLALDTSYQLQLNLSEPEEYNRIVQYAGAYLGYTFAPQWETGISYRLTLSDYTGQVRYDAYHLVLGQLVYAITPSVRMSLYGALSFGRSSDPLVRFNDIFFGFSLDATLTLF